MIAKNRKFKKGIFLIIPVLIIIGFLVISNFKISQKRTQLRSQIEALKKEIQILEEKKQKLETGISESEKESYLEKKARENLGLKKPEEEVIVVLPTKESEQKERPQQKNIWQTILEKLGF